MRNGTAKPLLAHCLPLCEELLVFGEGREKISESEKRELRQAIQEATITYFFYDLPSADIGRQYELWGSEICKDCYTYWTVWE